MSLPSDNENFKKEPEAFPNKDCSSDDSERTTPERRKKRKTPEDNSSSNSGDKKVGKVREDMKQLKVTGENNKNSDLKTVEPPAKHHAGTSTSRLPQRRESDLKRTEEVAPPTEDVTTAKIDVDLCHGGCAAWIPDEDNYDSNTDDSNTDDSNAESSSENEERFHLAREETSKDYDSEYSDFGSRRSIVKGKHELSDLQDSREHERFLVPNRKDHTIKLAATSQSADVKRSPYFLVGKGMTAVSKDGSTKKKYRGRNPYLTTGSKKPRRRKARKTKAAKSGSDK